MQPRKAGMHFPFPGNGRFFTLPCYFRACDEKSRPPRIDENDRSPQPIRATASPCDPLPPAAQRPLCSPAKRGCISGDAGARNMYTTVMESMIMKKTIALLSDNVREQWNRPLADPRPGRADPAKF
jgi:hypothetical protein